MAGKGDRPRKCNGPKYRDNYDAIEWGRNLLGLFEDLDYKPDINFVKEAAAHQLSEDIKEYQELLKEARDKCHKQRLLRLAADRAYAEVCKECEEQARLLGKSASREAALLAQIQSLENLANTYKRERDEALGLSQLIESNEQDTATSKGN